jgi:NAD(P)-dependent dehydrogenase (short-subunit alcohol dehydrogenase family)
MSSLRYPRDLEGKVALVTGAGSGIGQATARQLGARGARVAALDINNDRVAEMAKELGGDAIPLTADVSSEQAMRTAFAKLQSEAGRLDIVVVNAGINGQWAPIDELQPDEWDRTIAINLRGTYLTIHLAVPMLKAAGAGAIVMVSSINGTRTFTTPGATVYTATKGAQAAIAQQLALELGMHRIRVNTVCPGSTVTHISESTFRRNLEAARVPVMFPIGDVPITGGKPALPEDIADSICFLVSDQSRHINGAVLHIDGGQSLLR